jgi:hypothetical protein
MSVALRSALNRSRTGSAAWTYSPPSWTGRRTAERNDRDANPSRPTPATTQRSRRANWRAIAPKHASKVHAHGAPDAILENHALNGTEAVLDSRNARSRSRARRWMFDREVEAHRRRLLSQSPGWLTPTRPAASGIDEAHARLTPRTRKNALLAASAGE